MLTLFPAICYNHLFTPGFFWLCFSYCFIQTIISSRPSFPSFRSHGGFRSGKLWFSPACLSLSPTFGVVVSSVASLLDESRRNCWFSFLFNWLAQSGDLWAPYMLYQKLMFSLYCLLIIDSHLSLGWVFSCKHFQINPLVSLLELHTLTNLSHYLLNLTTASRLS